MTLSHENRSKHAFAMSRRRRSLFLFGVSLCLTSLVFACDSGPDDIRIFNATSETVVLVASWRGNEVIEAEIPANQGWSTHQECIEADLIARDSGGTEIAQRPGPFCRGDAEWVIGDPAS